MSTYAASIADFCEPVVTWQGSSNTATNGPAVCPSFSSLVTLNPNIVLDSITLFYTIGVTPQNLAGGGAATFNIVMSAQNPSAVGAPTFPAVLGNIISQAFSGNSAQSTSGSVVASALGTGLVDWSPLTNIEVTQGYGSASFDFSVRYDYRDLTPNGDVPEPSTMALMGAGLVGLVMAARRRRAA
jgi:hypothetical protein